MATRNRRHIQHVPRHGFLLDSGRTYLARRRRLDADGFVELERLVPVRLHLSRQQHQLPHHLPADTAEAAKG